jgi:phosphoserine phosphatase RsbU/P
MASAWVRSAFGELCFDRLRALVHLENVASIHVLAKLRFPPIIVRPRTQCCELFHLRAQAVPIGMYAEVQSEATQFQLAKDDIVVAYTDGITEAANPSGQLWGVERLESLLRSCSQMAPGEIVERILAEVSDFANDEPQRDDVTLVVMKVQEGCDI